MRAGPGPGWLGLFRVKVADQLRRAFEIGKEHGNLLALAFQSTAGGENLLGEVEWGVGEGCRRGHRCRYRGRGHGGVPDPDQHIAVLIACEPLPLDEFKPEVLQRLVIELELPLEHAVRHTAPPLQHGKSLVDDFFKRHDGPFPSLVAPCHLSGSLSYHRTQGGCVGKDAHLYNSLILHEILFIPNA